MASSSTSAAREEPTIVDSYVPVKDNFDGESEDRTEGSADDEKNWELERDLALHPPQDWALNEKDGANETFKHMSPGRRKTKETKNDSLLSVLCAYIVEHQVGE